MTRLENLQTGDRLYSWDDKMDRIGQAGLYTGNGYFVHASSERGTVVRESLGQPHWINSLVQARR